MSAAAARAVLAARLFAREPTGFGGIVLRAAAGPARDALLALIKASLPKDAPVRRVPMGVDDDRLIGGLDVVATLRDGGLALRPGLLAEADGGVLVIASAERLPAGRAGRIAAALDAGGVHSERDGRSAFWASRFGFVALDEGGADEALPSVLRERAAFWVDLEGLSARDLAVDPALMQAVPDAAIGDDQIAALCAAADALGVMSARASVMAVRAARAHATLAGRAVVEDLDLAMAAALVLAPRATRAPSAEQAEAEAEPPPPSDGEAQTNPADATSLDDLVVSAARAAIPQNLLAALAAGAGRQGQSGQGAQRASIQRGRPIGVRAGLPRNGARLALLATLRAAAPWQKLRRTLRASPAPVLVTREDLRVRRFQERSETSVVFIVDASGSAAFQRLAEVKGAIELILADAYIARTHVALVTFRQESAEILLAPTRSLSRAKALLSALPGGGATPLAAGLEAGFALCTAERAKGRSVLAMVMSDGRANVARDGARDRSRAGLDALAAAQRFRAAGLSCVFVDTGRWPAPENAALAKAMGARYAPLPFADAAAVQALAHAS